MLDRVFLVLILHWGAPSALAVNGFDIVSRFLEARSFEVGMDTERGEPGTPMLMAPQSFGVRYFYDTSTEDTYVWKYANETYLVMDRTGQYFEASLMGPEAMWAAYALHHILELLEIPHLGSYPSFLLRGSMHVPTKEQAKQLFPKLKSAGTYPQDGQQWTPVMIRPLIWQEHHDKGAALSVEALTQRFIEELFLYLTFAVEFRTGKNQGARVLLEPYGLMNRYLIPPKEYSLRQVLYDRNNADRTIADITRRMAKLSPEEGDLFLQRVNRFITLWERLLSGKGFWTLFEPVARNELLGKGPMVDIEGSIKTMKSRVQAVTRDLRGELHTYLKNRIGGTFAQRADPLLPPPATLPTPIAALPAKIDPHTLQPLPYSPDELDGTRDLLFALAFMSEGDRAIATAKLKANWLRDQPDLAPHLTHPGSVIYHMLLDAKRSDSKHQLICSDISPEAVSRMARRDVSLLQPQFHLNERLSSGVMVVYAPNDAEGEELTFTLSRMAPTVPLHSLKLEKQQGFSLSNDDWQKITSEALSKKIKFLVIMELGHIPKAMAEELKKKDIVVLHFDHHADGASDRRHALAAIEQFWNFAGYAPSAFEWITAAFDRSGAGAFADIAFTADKVMQWVQESADNGWRRNQMALETLDRLVIPEEPRGPLVIAAEPFRSTRRNGFYPSELMTYPQPPANTLLVGEDSVWFLGQPKLIDALYEHFQTGPLRDHHYCGGESRFGYWGCRIPFNTGSRDRTRSHIADQVRAVLRAKLAGTNPCWLQVTRWAE